MHSGRSVNTETCKQVETGNMELISGDGAVVPLCRSVVQCLCGEMRLWVEGSDWWFVAGRQQLVQSGFNTHL